MIEVNQILSEFSALKLILKGAVKKRNQAGLDALFSIGKSSLGPLRSERASMLHAINQYTERLENFSSYRGCACHSG
jgi:hypothetical protein